ncbi:MAG: endonuclease/exonuclease/phosphatase family protein [Flavobacteriales bacterium]|nr:endonuclease/exonuclease/phosphatase family protein [Flavobacteriales bacterium]
MRLLFIAAAFVPFLFASSCSAQSPKKEFIPALVGFYNIENLYDTLDAPGVDDAEYLPGSAKQWGTQRYKRKLERLAHVIGDMGKDLHPQGVALLGLAEVENRAVLEDLVATEPIASRKYGIVHEDGPDRRGVDVALLYNPALFKVLGHKSYRLTMPDKPDFRTRDQLLVSGILDGDTMHVIVAHWPSRRGGEKRSMPNRKAAAELGRHIVDSLLARNPDARILYMGDLNDDPVNPSVVRFLRSTGQKEKAVEGMLFNPMHTPYQKGIGSLAWRDAWNLFDQIIVSPSLVTGKGGSYRYYGVRIFNEPYLRQKDGNFKDYPWRTFVGDTYSDGYSDHFPVFLILVKEAQ